MTPTFYIWHWTPKWKLRQLAVPVPGQEAGSKFSGTEGMFCTVLGCWLPLCLLCPFVKIFLRLPQTLIESSGKCNWITLYLNVIRISIRGKTTKVFKWLFFFLSGASCVKCEFVCLLLHVAHFREGPTAFCRVLPSFWVSAILPWSNQKDPARVWFIPVSFLLPILFLPLSTCWGFRLDDNSLCRVKHSNFCLWKKQEEHNKL